MTPPPPRIAAPSLLGPAASLWSTNTAVRRVLVVARTRTSFVWLLELLTRLLNDRRVQVVFTVDDDQPSAFSDGVIELVNACDCVVIPWSQAVTMPVDLVVSAHESGRLEAFPAPLLVLPHGPGYNRELVGGASPEPSVAVAGRRTAATVAALPAADERVHPAAVPLVSGDPCRDSLMRARARRTAYRRALGVRPDASLVTVTSTWGRYSLWATWPDLVAQLLAALPSSSHRVALILHPNVWSTHGAWQIRTWMRRELAAGLILVPWEQGWRQTVVAADLVVGDHGSVGFYARSIGTRFADGTDRAGLVEIAQGVPLADHLAESTALRRGDDLRSQVDALLLAPSPVTNHPTVTRAFAHPDEAHHRLRAAIYDLLLLSEPGGRLSADVPAPIRLRSATPQSWVVSDLSNDMRGPTQVELHPLVGTEDLHSSRPHWVLALTGENDVSRLDLAAVVIDNEPVDGDAAVRLDELRHTYAGARYVGLTVGGWLVLSDGRAAVRVRADDADVVRAAAVVHTARIHEHEELPRVITMTVDGGQVEVEVEPLTDPAPSP